MGLSWQIDLSIRGGICGAPQKEVAVPFCDNHVTASRKRKHSFSQIQHVKRFKSYTRNTDSRQRHESTNETAYFRNDMPSMSNRMLVITPQSLFARLFMLVHRWRASHIETEHKTFSQCYRFKTEYMIGLCILANRSARCMITRHRASRTSIRMEMPALIQLYQASYLYVQSVPYFLTSYIESTT